MRVETFDFPDVVGKWIQGKGLPYAIVEDLDAVPRDARADMVTLRTFPPARRREKPPRRAAHRGLTPIFSFARASRDRAVSAYR